MKTDGKQKKGWDPVTGPSLGYLQKDYLQLRGGDPQPVRSPRRRVFRHVT